MATLEKIVVKRKCNLTDREGDFALTRKNVRGSIVRLINPDTGELGPEESIDTSLVTNERRYEQAKVPKQQQEEYPADRPERKVCLIQGRGNTRYHLIRQGADWTKVLEVGTGGKGEWVANHQIADKFTVPSPSRGTRYVPRQPIRVCQIQGREGNFLLLRQTVKGTRVYGPLEPGNWGETIDNSMIIGESKVILHKTKKDGETTETATIVASTPPQPGDEPNIPESDSPLHGHHPAVDDYPEAAQLPAEPEEQAPPAHVPPPQPTQMPAQAVQQQPPPRPAAPPQAPQGQPPQGQRPVQPGQQQPPRPAQPGQPQGQPPRPPQQQGQPGQPQGQRPGDPRFQPGAARPPQTVPQRPAAAR